VIDTDLGAQQSGAACTTPPFPPPPADSAAPITLGAAPPVALRFAEVRLRAAVRGTAAWGEQGGEQLAPYVSGFPSTDTVHPFPGSSAQLGTEGTQVEALVFPCPRSPQVPWGGSPSHAQSSPESATQLSPSTRRGSSDLLPFLAPLPCSPFLPSSGLPALVKGGK